ncbi:YopT-type cysteine protease domain-containing protein [Vibrio sp. S4M6]|uniref:YopT-type cysteine protease domain-containing protein n=1 Tax=Vibrio sinus TaxID=2946865 RepID=UPI00202AC050|nr:YopT-type cysteine protease domain-containing protein [Vibrio sinus]MCL9782014.1 YopT-type cysteine protease domain-containing protein [Vibrio sinus]
MSKFKEVALQFAGKAISWKQDNFLVSGQVFGKGGICMPLALKWISCRTFDPIKRFGPEMKTDDAREEVMFLKSEQHKKTSNNIMREYLSCFGLQHEVSHELKGRLDLVKVLQLLSRKPGYYVLGLTNKGAMISKSLQGHAFAIDSYKFRFFDPNYGQVNFQSKQNMCAFIREWIIIEYSDLSGESSLDGFFSPNKKGSIGSSVGYGPAVTNSSKSRGLPPPPPSTSPELSPIASHPEGLPKFKQRRYPVKMMSALPAITDINLKMEYIDDLIKFLSRLAPSANKKQSSIFSRRSASLSSKKNETLISLIDFLQLIRQQKYDIKISKLVNLFQCALKVLTLVRNKSRPKMSAKSEMSVHIPKSLDLLFALPLSSHREYRFEDIDSMSLDMIREAKSLPEENKKKKIRIMKAILGTEELGMVYEKSYHNSVYAAIEYIIQSTSKELNGANHSKSSIC